MGMPCYERAVLVGDGLEICMAYACHVLHNMDMVLYTCYECTVLRGDGLEIYMHGVCMGSCLCHIYATHQRTV